MKKYFCIGIVLIFFLLGFTFVIAEHPQQLVVTKPGEDPLTLNLISGTNVYKGSTIKQEHNFDSR